LQYSFLSSCPPFLSIPISSYVLFLVFLLPRRPPLSPLFPYTTLFRSRSPSRSALSTGRWMPTRCARRQRRRRRARALTCCSSARSEEHTSELQSPDHLVCRLLLEKKKKEKKKTLKQQQHNERSAAMNV